MEVVAFVLFVIPSTGAAALALVVVPPYTPRIYSYTISENLIAMYEYTVMDDHAKRNLIKYTHTISEYSLAISQTKRKSSGLRQRCPEISRGPPSHITCTPDCDADDKSPAGLARLINHILNSIVEHVWPGGIYANVRGVARGFNTCAKVSGGFAMMN